MHDYHNGAYMHCYHSVHQIYSADDEKIRLLLWTLVWCYLVDWIIEIVLVPRNK